MGIIPPKYTAAVANAAPVPLELVTTIELAREPAGMETTNLWQY